MASRRVHRCKIVLSSNILPFGWKSPKRGEGGGGRWEVGLFAQVSVVVIEYMYMYYLIHVNLVLNLAVPNSTKFSRT